MQDDKTSPRSQSDSEIMRSYPHQSAPIEVIDMHTGVSRCESFRPVIPKFPARTFWPSAAMPKTTLIICGAF